MDTFHPGVKTIIIGLLSAFLLTKNGRHAGAEILHKRIKMTIVFWLPLRVRCNLIKRILSMPPKRANRTLSQATKPWGYQWDFITEINKDTWKGHWIVPESDKVDKKKRISWLEETAKDVDLVIYYIHGGGFRAGDSVMYMESFIHIIQHIFKKHNMKTRIFSIDYKKMSDNVRYNRTKEDCLNGYRYLIKDLNIDPKKMIIAGDSAGGNLVATCLLAIKNIESLGLPQPAGNVQISPWVTIQSEQKPQIGKKYQDCIDFDMLSTHHGDYFMDEIGLRNPNISPLFGSFVGICPTLITYGGTEVFQHDVKDFIECLLRDKVKVDVITRPEVPHIWLISSILSPTHKIWENDCSRLADWCVHCVTN